MIVPQLPWIILTMLALVFYNSDKYTHPGTHALGSIMLILAFIYFVLYWGACIYEQCKSLEEQERKKNKK